MPQTKLSELKGVGKSTEDLLESIGIKSVSDLLAYFPRDYQDLSQVSNIKDIKPGPVTLRAEISSAKGRYAGRGMHLTDALATDKTGSVKIIWFNQPYRAASIKSGETYFISGKLALGAGKFSIQNPNIELATDVPLHSARIVPIYRESKGVSAKLIRKLVAEALKHLAADQSILPPGIIKQYKLLSTTEAITQLHFPESADSLAAAKRTMAFIEVFELMLASKIIKQELSAEVAPSLKFDEQLARKFVDALPYKLTPAQKKSAWAALQDLEKTTPMNRLIEGDVGSGKTVVAALTSLMALKDGYQVALLAPTELLARQHADSILELLKPLGISEKVGLLVGSLKSAQKTSAKQKIESGQMKFVIGTHAIIQEDIKFSNLGLVIVDEQHRFGVEQRRQLLKSGDKMPHVLSMTATPIPRSLALTLYGELDISLLDALPPGRRPIETRLASPNSRQPMEEHIRAEIDAGHQIYVVCPVIGQENLLKTVSAEETHKRLSTQVFKDKRVGLLHGKLRPDEKIEVMDKFVAGKLDILVSTTVIEVGVNVPNATVMVIEGADRFGLAQMHQLRGRVGRSTHQSYCYVVPTDSKTISKRLRAFVRLSDGFKLAELDLELRGPGAIYGRLQHGDLDLRFASLSDVRLLADTRQAVGDFVEQYSLQDYPLLAKRIRAAQAVITLN